MKKESKETGPCGEKKKGKEAKRRSEAAMIERQAGATMSIKKIGARKKTLGEKKKGAASQSPAFCQQAMGESPNPTIKDIKKRNEKIVRRRRGEGVLLPNRLDDRISPSRAGSLGDQKRPLFGTLEL